MNEFDDEIEEFAEWMSQQLRVGIHSETPIALGKTFERARKRLSNLERKALDAQRVHASLREVLYAD